MRSEKMDHHDDIVKRDWWIPLTVGSVVVVVLALAAALFLGQRGQEDPAAATPLVSRIGLAARAALVAWDPTPTTSRRPEPSFSRSSPPGAATCPPRPGRP